jgi:hypothetical protein
MHTTRKLSLYKLSLDKCELSGLLFLNIVQKILIIFPIFLQIILI